MARAKCLQIANVDNPFQQCILRAHVKADPFLWNELDIMLDEHPTWKYLEFKKFKPKVLVDFF